MFVIPLNVYMCHADAEWLLLHLLGDVSCNVCETSGHFLWTPLVLRTLSAVPHIVVELLDHLKLYSGRGGWVDAPCSLHCVKRRVAMVCLCIRIANCSAQAGFLSHAIS